MSTDPAKEWIQRDAKGLPPLEDLSLKGRQDFLARHEAQLGMYWTKAFELELYNRPGWLDVSHVLADGRDEQEAGEWIAERLIERLRTRPEFKWAPPWTSLEPWYRWLRGRQGTSQRLVRRRAAGDGDDGGEQQCEAEWSEHSSELALIDRMDLQDMVATLRALIQEWADILVRISRSTRLPSLEVDWLWATCVERRALAQALRGQRVDARFLEQNKKALTRGASVQGSETKERIARGRRGAAACFRFNLEVLAASHPTLRRAHQVFLGPVEKPDASPARPAAKVGAEEVKGFRETLRLTARRSGHIQSEDPTEPFWGQVFGAALVKEVARLLPSRERMAVECDWAELTRWAETSEDSA
ncbi:hypothetical protein D187_008047 [Cystobacter fuscus DSM 2262]|uniref:Uncharacterized protein n=1 Tax=Cystobacter fuscus (strain ATCC 25194 / DSM 2262 / NBRC 100088 / M29) TaxID=1242864 RepID=S9NWX9_CYSF2|nr:hypothetical protein [Cystobacter fuscus]EPX56705.1 hypothetical protein D187_008047 [Cystobacter fuscus DSM 2262]